MTKDYKNRATHQRNKKSKPIAGWWWLVTGLLIGGFMMFLSNLQDNTPKQTSKKITAPATQRDVREVKKAVTTLPKAIDSNLPRFDFYQILPEMEIVIPEHEIEERRRLEGTGKSKPGTFIIQIGSFRRAEQADTLKARLALLGVETTVQVVDQNGSIWHRVKAGPYDSFNKVDKIQNRLHHNNIDSIAIKLK